MIPSRDVPHLFVGAACWKHEAKQTITALNGFATIGWNEPLCRLKLRDLEDDQEEYRDQYWWSLSKSSDMQGLDASFDGPRQKIGTYARQMLRVRIHSCCSQCIHAKSKSKMTCYRRDSNERHQKHWKPLQIRTASQWCWHNQGQRLCYMTVKDVENDELGTLTAVGCFTKLYFLSFLDQASKNIESLYDSDHWSVALQKISVQCHLIAMRLYLIPRSQLWIIWWLQCCLIAANFCCPTGPLFIDFALTMRPYYWFQVFSVVQIASFKILTQHIAVRFERPRGRSRLYYRILSVFCKSQKLSKKGPPEKFLLFTKSMDFTAYSNSPKDPLSNKSPYLRYSEQTTPNMERDATPHLLHHAAHVVKRCFLRSVLF